jgi:asparagine synthase (glutamine-hydrolysing)
MVIIDSNYKWKSKDDFPYKVNYIGREKTVDDLLGLLADGSGFGMIDLCDGLANLKGNFAVIIEGPGWILAVVDKIRSYPVSYVKTGSQFWVSNSARRLKGDCQLREVEELSLLEFRTAGYVTGGDTLYRNLHQLQAGELLLWDSSRKELQVERYYLFYPQRVREEKVNVLIEELDAINESIILRNMEDAHGAPIWVPLSGGLDSRLILSKLVELGYDRLKAFSYGPPSNHEAKAAKYVADKLGVPWIFVPSSHRQAKEFFHSPVRKRYWAFCDGLCSVPNMQDIEPLLRLRGNSKIPEDAIIVNGQSGDFITGGHISEFLMQEGLSARDLLDAIIGKHFSLWLHLKTAENLEQIGEKVLKLLNFPKNKHVSREEVVRAYECWEWQERQCKYVINGQRIYDFLGFGWELPLWDSEYLHFWDSVPVELRYGQNLYRRYLSAYDYKGIFKGFNPKIWRWQGISMAIIPVARLAQVLFGERYKKVLYKYASYFGYYGSHYAAYGMKYFLEKIPNARNVLSFYVETWMQENSIPNGLPG